MTAREPKSPKKEEKLAEAVDELLQRDEMPPRNEDEAAPKRERRRERDK
jgi:hypothetical protein